MERLTLKESLSLTPDDLKGLNTQELLKILAPVRDAANKRINRLESAGQPSPALAAIQKTGGKLYGSKWSTTKALRQEIQRGVSFLNYQTSTVKGARSYEKRMTGSITGGVRYGDMTPSQIGKYWDIMHKMKEAGIQLSGEDYDAVKALIRNSVSSDDPDNAFLSSVPAESHDYIMERMPESDDPTDRILSAIESYIDWKVDEGYVTEDEEDEENDYIFL